MNKTMLLLTLSVFFSAVLPAEEPFQNLFLQWLRSGKINTAAEIEAFADGVVQGAKSGASYVGGCCGTNADYIRRIAEKLQSAGLR